MMRKIAMAVAIGVLIGLSGIHRNVLAAEHKTKVDTTERVPPISRYEEVFDFGSVSVEAEIKHIFIISNKGNDTLQIGKASSSCDYVQIVSYPQEIPPHEKGQLEILVIPSEPGETGAPLAAVCTVSLETPTSTPSTKVDTTERVPPIPFKRLKAASTKVIFSYELRGKIKGKASHQEKNGGRDGKQSPTSTADATEPSLTAWSPDTVTAEPVPPQLIEKSPIPAQLLTRRLKKRNSSLLISPKSVGQKLKEKHPLALIDVRDSQEFEKFRIPGSLNIPLFALKTKTFFKSRHLVLINEGYSYSQLEQECRKLRDSGFTAVSILDGGLLHWKERGGPLEGDVLAQQEMNKVPPQIFFEERNYDDWMMIDISAPGADFAAPSKSKQREARRLLPQAISIPFPFKRLEAASTSDDTGAQAFLGALDELAADLFISQIKAAIDKNKSESSTSTSTPNSNSTSTPILLFNDHGEQYARIEKIIQKAGIEHTFYLKDGWEGYKAFLQQQGTVWQPKGKVKTSGKKCGSCP